MANRYTAQLPTGRLVVMEELTTQEQMLALAAGSAHQTEQQARFGAQLESIRLMVKGVSEPGTQGEPKPLTFSQLEGGKIDEVFTPKEINALMILYGSIMGAEEAEKKAILASMKISSGVS